MVFFLLISICVVEGLYGGRDDVLHHWVLVEKSALTLAGWRDACGDAAGRRKMLGKALPQTRWNDIAVLDRLLILLQPIK
ncbi:hypothetical protein GALL_390580 [mine drainage metagenome]|uniref:Uncharacterized protein n=1 Tax=mine drainage metagenome TaxID=410659 RepID=A0A1J5QNX6_9ZZZZ